MDIIMISYDIKDVFMDFVLFFGLFFFENGFEVFVER